MGNLTLPTDQNLTGMFSLFEYVQGVSDGTFFPMILFAIFIIVFVSLKMYSTPRAFAGAAFFNFVIGGILGILGLIAPWVAYLGVIIVGFAVVWLHIENSQR